MIQRSDTEWLEDLLDAGQRKMAALADLQALIAQRLPLALHGKFDPDNPDDKFILDTAIIQTLSIVETQLPSFDRCSPLTTWALKIAVRQFLLGFRQKRWQENTQINDFPEIPPAFYELLVQDERLQQIHKILAEELSEAQRLAIRSMVMFRMPKEEVAQKLGMERADYFQMIHDARLRLKKRFQAEGFFFE